MTDITEDIATVRIELRDTDPLIWRQVEVPTSVTLKGLHEIIQAAMGWLDYHLWEFTIGKQAYALRTSDGWGPEPERADKTHLCDVLKPGKTTIEYLYDFGDNWECRLVVTKARQGESGVLYPRYVGGEHNAPPEDCGGTPGFYHMLDALADPENPEHEDVSDWAGDYDPHHIDEEQIRAAMTRIARRRKNAAAKAAKKKAEQV
jgi:hypothetical protein